MSTAGRTRARRGVLAVLVGCAVFAVAVGPSTPAGAASDTVTTCAGSGPGSLPAVVGAAGSGDTVTFSVSCPPDAPIVLGSTLAFPANMTIDGPGPDEMAISGGGSVEVFTIQGRTVTLSGVTIEDGAADAVGDGAGGIYNNGDLTLIDSVVADNSADACGGIDSEYYLTLTDTTVADNIGGGVCSDQTHLTVSGSFILDNQGAGIDENSSTVSITQSTISGNTGGGLSNTFGSVGLYESTVSDNSGDYGGGIENNGQMTLTDSTVTGNSSSSDGGGGIDNGSQLTIADSTVSDNTAASGNGGGILTAGDLTVNDSTVAANSAPQGQGGGIWNDSGTVFVTLTASTVADNSALTGGNIYNTIGVGGRVSGTVTATATIVADSPSGGNCAGAPVTDDGYNLDTDGSCTMTAATDVDAKPAGLDPTGLQSNGGPTETIALQPGSPAFGLVTPAALCQNPDQRGVARPTPCAAGAFQTTVDTVTTCAATGPGSLPAVVAAASTGDTVAFSLSPSCPTITLSGPLAIGSDVRIDGPGAGVLAVSGHNAVEVIDVSPAATVTVAGLTVEDGSSGTGGGVLNGGTLTVLDSTVTSNTGGGIVNLSTGSVSILDSTVEKNSGSGLANEGGLASVDDSTVSGNAASAGAGVANTSGGAALVTDSTVAGNTATGTGGGIDNDDSTLLLGASTVAGNQASHGGGIANGDDGVAEMADTIVAGSHTSGGDCFTTGDGLIDFGGNLDDDGSCGLTDPSDLPDTAAGLDPTGLQNNGGPTATISLKPGSAAIGAVDDADACAVPDQRGGLRPTPCDIGAYQTDAGQTITFTSAPPPAVVLGDAPYTVSASASSGLPVTLSVDATAKSVCILSGSSVSFIGGGTCTIDARQGGNADYAAAPRAQQSFTVSLKPQAIKFTTTAPAGGTIGGPTYTVAATGGASGNPVVFSIDPSSASVCTITGATVSFTGQGSCVIDANQAGTSTYAPAPEVYQVVTVALITQVITFTSVPPPGAAVGGTYTVTATGGGSGNPVVFSLGVFDPPACTLSGATVTFIADGDCEIVANQAGSTAYAYAYTVIQAFTVGLTQYFTSAPSTTAVVGKPLNFTVTTAGTPTPSLKTIGKLPKGLHFVDHRNGTATLSGTPKKAGVDNLTFLAVFGKGKKKDVVGQTFTLTVSST